MDTQTKHKQGGGGVGVADAPLEISHDIVPPSIDETIAKAKAAVQAGKAAAKQSTKHTWYCTECGSAHIQLYIDPDTGRSGHHEADIVDGVPVDSNGKPLTGAEAKNMKMAINKARVTRGMEEYRAAIKAVDDCACF